MAQISNHIRCCATCAYWLGARTPHRLGYVELDSLNSRGRCGAKGINEGRKYQAIYICGNYCKWPVLQKDGRKI